MKIIKLINSSEKQPTGKRKLRTRQHKIVDEDRQTVDLSVIFDEQNQIVEQASDVEHSDSDAHNQL